MILYCHCVKDSKPNNSLCMKHSRGKYCNDRVLLNMIEEAITFCISLPGCFFFFFLAPLSFLRSPMAENSTTSNRVCLLSPSPGVPVLQKAQEITRGKT